MNKLRTIAAGRDEAGRVRQETPSLPSRKDSLEDVAAE